MSGFRSSKRKGISPLIAAVLLIAFTMTVAAILATWAQTFGRERLKGARQRGEQAIECSALSIRVESVSLTDSTVQAVTWNTGNNNLTDIQFVIYNQTDSEIPHKYSLENGNVTIQPGDFEVLKASGVTSTPDRLAIHAEEGTCPDVQPLYTCQYTDGEFIC